MLRTVRWPRTAARVPANVVEERQAAVSAKAQEAQRKRLEREAAKLEADLVLLREVRP